MSNYASMTYEQLREQEARERIARHEELLGIVNAVAKELGAAVLPMKEGADYGRTPDLQMTGGYRFSIDGSEYGKERERLSISGCYHEEKLWDFKPYGAVVPGISVSRSKPAGLIARDIERRFLPKLKVLVDEMRLRKLSSETYRDKCVGNATKLASLSGGLFEQQTKREYSSATPELIAKLEASSLAKFYGHVDVSSDSVSIELRSLSIGQAEAIIQVLDLHRMNSK